jgi:hypothetical protein
MQLNSIARNTHKTDNLGWYQAIEHNNTVDGKINRLFSDSSDIVIENANHIADFVDGKIRKIKIKYNSDTIEGTNKSEITIDSDKWLRFNTNTAKENSSYFVTFKSVSGLTGVSVSTDKSNSGLGRNLMQGKDGELQGMIRHNGKMSW